jgi:CAAX prenyl protease-like protein
MMKISHPAIPYTAPYAAFLFFLALKSYFPREYPIRVIAVAVIVILFSRKIVSLHLSHPIQSALVGALVFVVWIGPDLLSSTYRQHWLFHNALIGTAASSLPQDLRTDPVFLLFRIAGTAFLVPVIEELFWRGWLMRFLISPDFQRVRLGAYSAFSFGLTALLFASEHGPYWVVGLIAGIVYGWWMVSTESLGDCILAHGITNGCLAAYVIGAGQWQYWL